MKKAFLLAFFFISASSFSQSKKEQIEILTNRVDSLNRVVGEERSSNQNKIIEINSIVTKLEGQIAALSGNLTTLNKELQDSKDVILKKQKEIVENQIEISRLQSALKIKSDSLDLIRDISMELESQKVDTLFWENDYEFIILNYFDSNDHFRSMLGYGNLKNMYITIFDLEFYNFLEMIPKDEYEYWDIPSKAKFACGLIPAGTGDLFYSTEEENVIKIFKGYQGESPEDYQENINYELFKEIEKP